MSDRVRWSGACALAVLIAAAFWWGWHRSGPEERRSSSSTPASSEEHVVDPRPSLSPPVVEAGSLHLTATSPQGPLDGVAIRVARAPGAVAREVTSDADGHASVLGLTPGSFDVLASHATWGDLAVRVEWDGHSAVELPFEPRTHLSVEVVSDFSYFVGAVEVRDPSGTVIRRHDFPPASRIRGEIPRNLGPVVFAGLSPGIHRVAAVETNGGILEMLDLDIEKNGGMEFVVLRPTARAEPSADLGEVGLARIDGRPLDSATLTLRQVAGTRPLTVTTDRYGAFRYDPEWFQVGYYLEARIDGEAEIEPVVMPVQGRLEIDFSLERIESQLAVLDSLRTPVVGARVKLVHDAFETVRTTDASGCLSLDGLPLGEYRADVEVPTLRGGEDPSRQRRSKTIAFVRAVELVRGRVEITLPVHLLNLAWATGGEGAVHPGSRDWTLCLSITWFLEDEAKRTIDLSALPVSVYVPDRGCLRFAGSAMAIGSQGTGQPWSAERYLLRAADVDLPLSIQQHPIELDQAATATRALVRSVDGEPVSGAQIVPLPTWRPADGGRRWKFDAGRSAAFVESRDGHYEIRNYPGVLPESVVIVSTIHGACTVTRDALVSGGVFTLTPAECFAIVNEAEDETSPSEALRPTHSITGPVRVMCRSGLEYTFDLRGRHTLPVYVPLPRGESLIRVEFGRFEPVRGSQVGGERVVTESVDAESPWIRLDPGVLSR